MYTTLCEIGVFCTAIVCFKIFRALFNILYESVIGNTLNLGKIDWRNLGEWALVTGSTDGIGKAYSEALAKKGFKMVLISRTQSKLEAIAKEIKEKYKVEVKVIAADFTRNDIYDGIQKHLDGLEIGVLINNVGSCNDYPEYFLDIPNHAEFVKNIINCNILSVMTMCKLVMPDMVKRRKGVIVNNSSISAMVPFPMFSAYSATKAAVVKFTKDLSCEYGKDGLIIQAVCPGYVATKLSNIRKTSWLAPSPREYVNSALNTVGLSEVTTGYLPHTLLKVGIDLVNGCSENLCRYIVMASFKDFRERALKKAAKVN